ncbi:hypothetical protein [Glaesserella sp.]|uniref:hypothetical protein n=1 Tax=Glaesserella sp. TaxID=2094731 RepID=UPI0035A0378C
MDKKTVILCISTNLGISKLISDNLEYHGFNVVKLVDNNGEIEKFEYPSIWERIKIHFRKKILKEKKAKCNYQSNKLILKINNNYRNTQFDYALFFLAQNFSVDLVKTIKEKTKNGKIVNYQWDGMKRYPHIYNYINLFDRFLSFEPSDITENILPATSFYFDNDLEKKTTEYDFYFLGSHNSSRTKIICQFADYAEQKNLNINIQIVCPKNKLNECKKIYPKNITLLEHNQVKTFSENLLASRKAKILVDFVIDEHQGLSLRTFEALGHDKKLITTNKDIMKYDFYHPDNIFVLNNNLDKLPEFLEKPYHSLDSNIKQKYSFGNWIRYVLDIQPYQPILLPTNKDETI